MNRSFLRALIRHLISIIIVVSLCAYYSYQTGRVFVWFFFPISLIPVAISVWDYRIRQKEINNEKLKDTKIDLQKISEIDKQ